MAAYIYPFKEQKENAVNMFREVLNTPGMREIDVHFHVSLDDPMEFNYKIDRVVLPVKDDDSC